MRPSRHPGDQRLGRIHVNLRTLEVDVNASEALIAGMPAGTIAVSESGLRTADDLRSLRGLGYRAFLVGERFMTARDPGGELRGLLEGCSDTRNTKDTRDQKGMRVVK